MEPPQTYQPSQSPPLLLGAVCKRWRDITLTTPQLWTDIIVDLVKSPEGQSDMVDTWARRSGVLPLNISVAPCTIRYPEDIDPEDEYEDLSTALKSLVDRWNDMSLDVPDWFINDLFHNLREAPHVQMLHLERWNPEFADIKTQHLVSPRCFIASYFDFVEIPFKWNNLVFLDIGETYSDQILLVIHHAQNLQFCLAHGDTTIDDPPSPIINHRSLMYLHTNCSILDDLTLPSLSHLDYRLSSDNVDQNIESIVGFFARSSPPLSNFILRYSTREDLPIPSFKRIPQITSLFIHNGYRGTPPNSAKLDNFLETISQPSSNTVLPRLRALSLSLHHRDFSAASWSLIGDLFLKDTQLSDACGRPLSEVKILSLNRTPADQVTTAISRDSLLRFLAIKKSGVDLELRDESLGDLLVYMANVHGVSL